MGGCLPTTSNGKFKLVPRDLRGAVWGACRNGAMPTSTNRSADPSPRAFSCECTSGYRRAYMFMVASCRLALSRSL